MTGQAVPEELSKIQEEYIAIDSAAAGMDINQIKSINNSTRCNGSTW